MIRCSMESQFSPQRWGHQGTEAPCDFTAQARLGLSVGPGGKQAVGDPGVSGTVGAR